MSFEMERRGIVVVAVTGRRIDAPNSQIERFPLAQVDAVKALIRELFQDVDAQAIVCSAACGADLIALDVASELGIEAHVMLPFAQEKFRETSVVDRPGEWGPLFDQLVEDAQRQGRLHLTKSAGSDHKAYLDAVTAILDQAAALARLTAHGQAAASPSVAMAVAVWDGEPRGPDDITAYFIDEARKRNYTVHEVLTRAGSAPTL